MKKRHYSHWVFLMLALLTVVSLTLAWQAIRSAASHQSTVDAILEDYSALIADDYVRSLRIKVGYEGIYKAIGILNSNGLINADISKWQSFDPEILFRDIELPSDWLDSVFVINLTGQWQSCYGITDQKLAEIISRVSLPPEPPFQVVHMQHKARTGLQVLIKRNDNSSLVLVFNPTGTGEILKNVFDTASLLPVALGEAKYFRPHIVLEVVDPENRTIFETNTVAEEPFVIARTMDASYSGLYAGFSIKAALQPEAAEVFQLVNSPLTANIQTLLLLLIAISLAFSSFVLIRRERQLMDMRGEFIARVSHELRTPLTQIRMFTESLILDRLPDQQQRAKALKIIDRETLRLSRLVENILRFSNEKQPSVPDEPVVYNLEKLLIGVKDEFELQLASSNDKLLIECDSELDVKFNREALVQILTNLLDNAIKYSPSGQTITIKTEIKGNLAISMTDEGPGIPAAEQKLIWRPYYRLRRETARAISGTGIGLAVATEMAEAMQAKITVSSSEAGSVFTLTFDSGF